MKVALTIGASDPTSGAGIQMDLKVFHALNVYGLTVITAVTAQSTQEFSSVYPLSGETIMKQFEILIKDIKPHAAKTGMLYSKEAVQCVIDSVKKFNLQNLVIDPVINATLGAKLIEDDALKLLKEELVPLSMAITANIPEAEFLTSTKIEKIDDFYKVAQKIYQMGTKTVIIKGGHFDNTVPDMLYDGKNFYKAEGEKISGQFHGTGCAFSSAFVSFICHGYKPVEALKASKNFVKRSIEKSLKIGHGIKLLIIPKE